MTDVDKLIEQLKLGVVEYPKRWSGDTHADMGGSTDYDATASVMSEAADALEDAQKRIAELEEVAIDVASSLAAAISLLKRSDKTAAPSDKMFDQMIVDYEKSLSSARAALNNTGKGG